MIIKSKLYTIRYAYSVCKKFSLWTYLVWLVSFTISSEDLYMYTSVKFQNIMNEMKVSVNSELNSEEKNFESERGNAHHFADLKLFIGSPVFTWAPLLCGEVADFPVPAVENSPRK